MRRSAYSEMLLRTTVCLMFAVALGQQPHEERAAAEEEMDTEPQAPQNSDESLTTAEQLNAPLHYTVPCSTYEPFVEHCHPSECARYVIDEFISDKEVAILRRIAEKGMNLSNIPAGPSILDINTGFLRDANGLQNLYSGGNDVHFSVKEYQTYEEVFMRIRRAIMDSFQIEHLFLTAPTFITRIRGSPDWEPKGVHDEYWHPHVDRENTAHYDYSGLLYLSTYGVDFEGGRFQFLDDEKTHTIEPRAGRLVMFTAGSENKHHLEKVESGERLVMSMWYTCDSRKEFASFLDGKPHRTFQRFKAEQAEGRRVEQARTATEQRQARQAEGEAQQEEQVEVQEEENKKIEEKKAKQEKQEKEEEKRRKLAEKEEEKRRKLAEKEEAKRRKLAEKEEAKRRKQEEKEKKEKEKRELKEKKQREKRELKEKKEREKRELKERKERLAAEKQAKKKKQRGEEL